MKFFVRAQAVALLVVYIFSQTWAEESFAADHAQAVAAAPAQTVGIELFQVADDEEATVRYFNRDIISLRGASLGRVPSERVAAIERRIA